VNSEYCATLIVTITSRVYNIGVWVPLARAVRFDRTMYNRCFKLQANTSWHTVHCSLDLVLQVQQQGDGTHVSNAILEFFRSMPLVSAVYPCHSCVRRAICTRIARRREGSYVQYGTQGFKTGLAALMQRRLDQPVRVQPEATDSMARVWY